VLLAAPPADPSLVHDFLRDRGSQSLAHVFTLLSFVLPVLPLQISYRALHSDEPVLKATALEYLDGVLPPDIRDVLWPFVSDEAPPAGPSRPAEEVLAALLKGSVSTVSNVGNLRRRDVERS
jgi:hypothetical protein